MAFDPSQISNLLAAWSPNDPNISIDGNGDITVPGGYGTSISLLGAFASQPSLIPGLGPQGQQTFNFSPTQYFTLSSAQTIAAYPTSNGFSVIWVPAFTSTGLRDVLSHSSNANDFVGIPNANNMIEFRRAGQTIVQAAQANLLKAAALPSVVALTVDFSVGVITPYLNGVAGTQTSPTPPDLTDVSGPWTFDRVGGSTNSIAGQCGPVLVYSRPLTQAEITELTAFLAPWQTTILYISAANGGSDNSIAPWQRVVGQVQGLPTGPYQTIANAGLIATTGMTIAPQGGELFRESKFFAQNTGVTIDGSLWGTSRFNGIDFQGQGQAVKAEIRWSTNPVLTRRTGTTIYAAGTLAPAAGTTQFGHFPGNMLYVIPGSKLQFGSQYSNPNFYAGTPTVSKCVCAPLPQFSNNGIRLFRTKTFAISAIGAGTGGVCRLTIPSTTGLVSGNYIFVADCVGTTEANSASETLAGMKTYNVINTTQIDIVGTTFVNAYVSSGWCYDANQQVTPGSGEWGHDTANFGGTVNEIYANAGISLQNGDLEIPNNQFPNFDMDSDGWTVNNIISLVSWQRTGGSNSLTTCNVTFNNCEFYFASQDGIDADNVSVVTLNNCVVGWTGSGSQYQQGPGDLVAAHNGPSGNPGASLNSAANVFNSLLLYGDGTCGHDLGDQAFGTFAGNLAIGHNIIRSQLSTDSGGGIQLVYNNVMILVNDVTGVVDSFAPCVINVQPKNPFTLQAYFNTIICYNTQAATTVGIQKTNTASTVDFRNNILIGFATGISGATNNWTGDYNDVYNCTTPYTGGITAGAHDKSSNPLITNSPTDIINFQPPLTSPVEGAGVTISGILTDYLGDIRPSPPTMGAFEGAAIPPSISIGLAHGEAGMKLGEYVVGTAAPSTGTDIEVRFNAFDTANILRHEVIIAIRNIIRILEGGGPSSVNLIPLSGGPAPPPLV